MARPEIGTRIPIGAVGTAVAADVRADKTFSSAAGIGIQGTAPVKAAATYTPGTADQIISAGQYLSGDQTIKGDPNLVPDKIPAGVTLFGVNGAYVDDQISAGDIQLTPNDLSGRSAYGSNYSSLVSWMINRNGSVRLRWQMWSQTNGLTVYTRVYRNGTPVSSEFTTNSDSAVEKTYDITVSAGDIVSIWGNGGSGNSVLIGNPRVYGSKSPIAIAILD